MESQCDFIMYFPAAPISDPAMYATLPRRSHLYLGETVQFLLVLRSRSAGGRSDGAGGSPWRSLVGSLFALASVSVAESRQQRPGQDQADLRSSSEDSGEEEPVEGERETTGNRERRAERNQTFKKCSLLLTHTVPARDGRQPEREPVKVRPWGCWATSSHHTGTTGHFIFLNICIQIDCY